MWLKNKGDRYRLKNEHVQVLEALKNMKTDEYVIQADVPDGVFELFYDAIDGRRIQVPEAAVSSLKELCTELGYHGLDEDISIVERFGPGEAIGIKREILLIREQLEAQNTMIEELVGAFETVMHKLHKYRDRFDVYETIVSRLETQYKTMEMQLTEGSAATQQTLGSLQQQVKTLQDLREDLKEIKQRDEIESGAERKFNSAKAMRRSSGESSNRRRFRRSETASVLTTGIIAGLRKTFGENIAENGTIEIQGSSTFRQQCNTCQQVIDYGWHSYWMTDNLPNSWIQFDFKARRVCIEEYTVISSGAFGYDPVQWVLEATDDVTNENSWDIIDTRNTDEMKGLYVARKFRCTRANAGQYYQFVRLRQTGKNSSGTDHLVLSEIDFFGKIRDVRRAAPSATKPEEK